MENRFDILELPEGHEIRFEERLEHRLTRNRRRARILRWTAAAAVLALVVLLQLPGGRSAVRRAHNPEGVYSAYLEEVGKLYELLADNSEDQDVDWESLLQELTDENIPLYDQLPEEMSRREKMAILKRHYGGILHEADQLKELNSLLYPSAINIYTCHGTAQTGKRQQIATFATANFQYFGIGCDADEPANITDIEIS